MTETAAHENEMRCQWCGVKAASGKATHCASCGAALILRESIGEMVIPGVTDVDPELQSYARPLHIPKGSPSLAIAGPAFGATAVGDPVGLLALGALAAVAANELAGASHRHSDANAEREHLGVPSPPVLEMVTRLNEEALADQDAPAPIAPAEPRD